MAKVQPIPTGYHAITPTIVCRDAGKAIDFYKRAFGAEELGRYPLPDGKIVHAELQIGDSRLMLTEEGAGGMNVRSPQTIGGTPVTIYLYVENVDKTFEQACNAGATVEQPVQDMFYGDRIGAVVDPFGHQWTIGTHIEDVSDDEVKRRMPQAMAAGSRN